MLNTKKNSTKLKHELPIQHKKQAELIEINEDDLNSVIRVLKTQAEQYKNAGLTQVSHWL